MILDMKILKYVLLILAGVFPIFAFGASFNRDLYYGMRGDMDVTFLQEFLRGQGVYDGPVTSNFFSLTREGVAQFQIKEGIEPSAGYFGPKTRARANEISAGQSAPLPIPSAAPSDKQIALLLVQIKELQDKIAALQSGAVLAPSVTSPAVVPPSVPPVAAVEPISPPPTPLPSAPAPVLEVSGNVEQQFPSSFVASLKIGDITIRNGTSEKIPFSQIIMDVVDQMNTTLNRGREVFFVLRKGPTIDYDTISKTSFKFNSNVPQPDSPHRSQVRMPYDVVLNSGDTQILGLWIDGLEYVTSGSVKFEFNQFLATVPISPQGGFSFTFKRD